MAERWRPSKVLVYEARLLQQRVSRAIARAEPPKKGGRAGGSFPEKADSKELIDEKPWGAIVKWSLLKQTFLWFNRGTVKQRARPINLLIDENRLRAAVEADAREFYTKRERKTAERLR